MKTNAKEKNDISINNPAIYSDSCFSDDLTFTNEEFEMFASLIYNTSGIYISDKKRMLIKSRLSQIIHNKKLKSFTEYYDHILNNYNTDELKLFINKICTNYTYFFRENDHFDFMEKTVLPELIKEHSACGKKELRIWSAGCSTGEEPYSILMTLHNILNNDINKWDIKILATDISESVLETAKSGIYRRDKLEKVPVINRLNFFDVNGNDTVRIKEEYRKKITFRRLNLMRNSLPFQHTFNIIFCRNVLIYFDQNTTADLIDRLYDHTSPNGYLFIGHSESLMFGKSGYQFIKPAIYQKQ